MQQQIMCHDRCNPPTLVRRVFKMQKSMSEILSPDNNDNNDNNNDNDDIVFAQDTFLETGP